MSTEQTVIQQPVTPTVEGQNVSAQPTNTEQPAAGEADKKIDIQNINLTVDETEEEKKAREQKELEDKEPVFERTENPGLNVALDYIEKLGYKPDNDAIQKAFDGDFTELEKDLAQKDPKNYKTYLELAKKAYNEEVGKQQAVIEETKKAVYSVVGDEKVWNDIRAFVKTHADEKERAEINRMLDGGPLQAKAVATYLYQLYRANPNTVVNPKEATQHGRTGSSNSYALSKAQYIEAVQALSTKVGAHRMNNSPEYLELQKRREAGRKAGL